MPGFGGKPRSRSRPAIDLAGDLVPAEDLLRDACRDAVAGKRAARLLAAWAAPFDLAEPELRLLWLLRGDGAKADLAAALDQAGLAERLAVSAAQVSAVVERLRLAGLVESVRDAGDRRRQFWRLTVAGEATVRAVMVSVETVRIRPLAPLAREGESSR